MSTDAVSTSANGARRTSGGAFRHGRRGAQRGVVARRHAGANALTARLRGSVVGTIPLVLGLAGAAALTAAAVVILLEVGVRRVEKLEL